MRKILLTAYGLCTAEIEKAFLGLIPKTSTDTNICIVSTAQPKLKEKHPQMISVKSKFHEIGFERVDFIDIEFDDVQKLRFYDVIFLNGGSPSYLIHHLKKSGADIILNELISEGKILVGLSAGSIALGPDNRMCNYIYPEDNALNGTDLGAVNAVDMRIYPHFQEHCGINPDIEEKVVEFELKHNCKVTRLNNNQAVLVSDDEIKYIGEN